MSNGDGTLQRRRARSAPGCSVGAAGDFTSDGIPDLLGRSGETTHGRAARPRRRHVRRTDQQYSLHNRETCRSWRWPTSTAMDGSTSSRSGRTEASSWAEGTEPSPDNISSSTSTVMDQPSTSQPGTSMATPARTWRRGSSMKSRVSTWSIQPSTTATGDGGRTFS